jgi:hypothetical protein
MNEVLNEKILSFLKEESVFVKAAPSVEAPAEAATGDEQKSADTDKQVEE